MIPKVALYVVKGLITLTIVAPLASCHPVVEPSNSVAKSNPIIRDVPVVGIEDLAKQRARRILEKCNNRNIDIYGDIPNDAYLLPSDHPDVASLKPRDDGTVDKAGNMTFVHAFEADSDASLWASAQVFIEEFPELVNHTKEYHHAVSKRMAKYKLGVGMWVGGSIGWQGPPFPYEGKGFWIDKVQYGIFYHTDAKTYSMGLSYRPLGPYSEEWLEVRDFWGLAHTPSWQPCDEYRYSLAERSPRGCHRHWDASCFVLQSRGTVPKGPGWAEPKAPHMEFHP